MNVVLVCSEYPKRLAGGGGIATRHVAKLLRASGHHVRIAGIYPIGLPFADTTDSDFYPIYQDRSRLGWVKARRTLYRQIKKWTQRKEIDVIEMPLTRGFCAYWPKLPIPIIVRIHGSRAAICAATNQPISFVHRQLEGKALKRADAVSAVSQSILDDVQRHYDFSAPTTVIHNPVRIPQAIERQISPGTIVYAGTLSKAKGIHTLLQAWKELAPQQENANLHLYGRQEFDVESILPDALQSRTHLHGHVSQEQLAEAFGKAAVAVFASQYEAFGLAAAEAMACGCPVVVSAAGFGKELVADGKTGRLVTANDATALAAAVNDLLTTPNKAEALGQAARQHVADNFAPQKITQQIIEEYQTVIKR